MYNISADTPLIKSSRVSFLLSEPWLHSDTKQTWKENGVCSPLYRTPLRPEKVASGSCGRRSGLLSVCARERWGEINDQEFNCSFCHRGQCGWGPACVCTAVPEGGSRLPTGSGLWSRAAAATERGPFGTVGDPWPQEMKECSLKKERGADKGEEPSSPWEGRQTALPFWNLREVWENKNSVASGERASSEPVDGFNLPISQLLNCLRTTYQNSARSSELSGYQSPSLKEEDTVFRKGTSNSPASPGAFCVFRATTQPLRLKTF